jgi:hypothetical protein
MGKGGWGEDGAASHKYGMQLIRLARHGFWKVCGRWGLYWAVEVASVVEADEEVGGGRDADSMITVRVEVDVRPALSVAT